MIVNVNSLERLVPQHVKRGDVTGQETLELHLSRYRFAASHLRPGRLLDIACGVGYGTNLMAELGAGEIEATGVDISAEAIAYARHSYKAPHVRYLVGDAMSFADQSGFDNIVSLETIEHLPDPERFIERLVGLLRPRGIIVGSVPVTPSVDVNPHHLHDFTERSFRRMLERRGLQEIACFRQVQPYKLFPLLTRREARAAELRKNLPAYYVTHPAGLVRRLWSTVRNGFTNRYTTSVWQARG